MAKRPTRRTDRLEDAARAAWLYYIAENTQDEIAEKMGISRQSAQRLVALAVRERLVKMRLDHPIGRCLDLAQGIMKRFGLTYCEVTFADPTSDDPALGIAQVAAQEIENRLSVSEPVVVAFGTGREIRGAVEQMSPMVCPQHKVVSLVGNLAPDGSASFNDVIMRVGDATQAPHYPMAVPVVATTTTERDTFWAQRPIKSNIQLARSADVAFVGIGEIDETPPLLTDGFITDEELEQIVRAGGTGEIVGWVFDQDGDLVPGHINARVASVPLQQPPGNEVIGVARGTKKLRAIQAALKGNWLSGLVTDEGTAEELLRPAGA